MDAVTGGWGGRVATALLLGLLGLPGASAASEDGWLDQARALMSGAWHDLLGSEQRSSFARVWDEALPRLEQTLELSDRHQELPASAWFGSDQASNQVAINELLDETIGILTIAPAQQYRERVRGLEETIREQRERIAGYRHQRIGAPAQSLVNDTTADLDANIRDAERRIAGLEQELTRVKGEFAGELQDLGLALESEQLDFLLSTVIGDDLVNLGIVFDNVKHITGQLEALMAESQHDLDSARRYYGMYTVMLTALDRMHQQLLQAINERYLVEIDGIIERTQKLTRDTRELQRQSPLDENLAANLKAQALTLETAALYRDYLLEQAREVAVARERLGMDIAIARNTYDTVRVSGELVSLMRSSRRLLDNLIERQVPALRTFQSREMQREFQNLTLQLRGNDPS